MDFVVIRKNQEFKLMFKTNLHHNQWAESLNVVLSSSMVTLDSAVDSIKSISFCDKNKIEV